MWRHWMAGRVSRIVQCRYLMWVLYRECERMGVDYTGYAIVKEVGP